MDFFRHQREQVGNNPPIVLSACTGVLASDYLHTGEGVHKESQGMEERGMGEGQRRKTKVLPHLRDSVEGLRDSHRDLHEPRGDIHQTDCQRVSHSQLSYTHVGWQHHTQTQLLQS